MLCITTVASATDQQLREGSVLLLFLTAETPPILTATWPWMWHFSYKMTGTFTSLPVNRKLIEVFPPHTVKAASPRKLGDFSEIEQQPRI